MLSRQPVAAGRFYPDNGEALRGEVRRLLDAGANEAPCSGCSRPWAVMLPHAGHVFCGGVIGRTLAGQELPERLIILCPNHTGRGQPLSVWPAGEWLTPLGPALVDTALAALILASGGGYMPDCIAHLGEHSIEVILPFLLEGARGCSPGIVPICVGTRNQRVLRKAGQALAKVLLQPQNAGVGLVISSDMNHYENERATLAKDELALAQILDSNPDGLLAVVDYAEISMCGAAPMALALYAARAMGGGLEARLVAHETSAGASGDYEHTVGYAGLRLYRKPAAQGAPLVSIN